MAEPSAFSAETIVESLGDPVCTIDAAGEVAYVNDAFESQTGYDATDAQGEPPTFVMSDDDAQAVESALESLQSETERETTTVEVELQQADNSVIPVECQIALLPPDGDGQQGAVLVLRDISELKKREARLEKFATVVSHDLRNPMDVAIGRAEVLPEVADVDEQTEAHLDDIYKSLKRMEELIQDVHTLTQSREETLECEPIALGAVATDAWSNVDTAEATLSVEAGQDVLANENSLLRLLENLFRNAIEHGGDATTVEVGLIEDEGPGFFVADDGPGIPTEDRSQVFEDGFSTSDHGSGLGLSIVREIAEAHGWSVRVNPEADGTRIEFTGVGLKPDAER